MFFLLFYLLFILDTKCLQKHKLTEVFFCAKIHPKDVEILSIYTERAAYAFKEKSMNCAQAVVYAFYPDNDSYLSAVSGFGGGMGRLREVCGAMSGAVFVLGLWFGYADSGLPSSENEANRKAFLYKKVQEFAKSFQSINGSMICRELIGNHPHSENPADVSERTKEFHKRPCVDIVVSAAEILEKMCPSQF